MIIPQWLIDFINTKDLEDLTDRVRSDSALQWQDVAPKNYGGCLSYQMKGINRVLDC